MIRKDPAQDTNQAHYYSQFWIEVAAGRPIGQSAQATTEFDEGEETDFEALLSEPPMPAAVVKAEPKPKAKAPEKKEAARSLSSLADLANIDLLMRNSAEMADDAVPDIEAGASKQTDSEIITNFDPNAIPVEEEEPPLLAEEGTEIEDFDEEEEEEDEWAGGRRPKPKKPPRREKRSF
ncbi:MAG: hypothetical protein IVW57_06050 [Ktedonobacterales bacterium]|nr:hypothetical protein [Ktedonobacterales bacterium]